LKKKTRLKAHGFWEAFGCKKGGAKTTKNHLYKTPPIKEDLGVEEKKRTQGDLVKLQGWQARSEKKRTPGTNG